MLKSIRSIAPLILLLGVMLAFSQGGCGTATAGV